MKKVLFFVLILFSIVSCGKKNGKPQRGFKAIFGVRMLPDSTGEIRVLGELTDIDDTASSKKGGVVYTKYYSERLYYPKLDSLGRTKKDSSGKVVFSETPTWKPISIDSVILTIEGVPIDSILPKGNIQRWKKNHK